MSQTLNLTTNQIEIITTTYSKFAAPHTNNYTLFRAKFKSCTLTIFKTQTMLIQGSNDLEIYNEILLLLGLKQIENTKIILAEKIKTSSLDSIGSDEVGTGDFFGPVIVVSCYTKATDLPFLKQLGVKDSKELSDEKIKEIAPLMMERLTYCYHILDNLKYNYLTFKCNYNMNEIKAIMHNSAIINLLKRVQNCQEIIIDAFTTEKKYFEYLQKEKNVFKGVKLVEKAENIYFSVACASIIARYKLIEEFEKLTDKEGFEIPKGAGAKVDTIIEKIYKLKGEKYLYNIGKCNFKNLIKIKSKFNK